MPADGNQSVFDSVKAAAQSFAQCAADIEVALPHVVQRAKQMTPQRRA
eukprot:SAG11_NODE_29190_length_313_cov_1.448598_1_plen_47_part_10